MRPGRPDTADRRGRWEGRGSDQKSVQRRDQIQRRRDDVARNRDEHRPDWERRAATRDSVRNDWRAHRDWRSRPDLSWVNNEGYWGDRWDSWESNCPQPVYVDVPVYYPTPMPDYSTVWTYADIATVATNIESLTRDMYDQMDGVIDSNPNREYATRLMNTLADLVDASENYTDAVYAGSDFVDSLDQLFYLEAEMKLARTILDGYSKANLVSDDQRALKLNVEQLLWTYHNNN